MKCWLVGCRRLPQRQIDLDLRAFVRLADHGKLAAGLLDPLTHLYQPQVSRPAGPGEARHVETLPVVTDCQTDASAAPSQLYPGQAGLGVLDDVIERLLHDAE